MEHWTERAVCQPHPAWDADRKPKLRVMIELESICARCPVENRCALHALETDAEAGIFAGVHLPEKYHHPSAWMKARSRLLQKAIQIDPTATTMRRSQRAQHDDIVYPCGTEAAYRRHKRRHEKACTPCIEAAKHARTLRRLIYTKREN